MMEQWIIGGTLIYIGYLIWESRQNQKNRNHFLHVIHVNGTRGKSTVSRLIDAGLRAGGYRVFTKTTGTSPRMIGVDGIEKPLHRKGKPNIREQIRVLKMARKQGAEVLVIECMAIKPELQKISQERILKADIGVVTNVRRDHLEEMGPGLQDVAEALGAVMPKEGFFVTGEASYYLYYERLGQQYRSRVLLAELEELPDIDFPENLAVALSVCNLLKVEKEITLDSFRNFQQDPGSLKIYKIPACKDKTAYFINAFAANDVDSTERIYKSLEKRNFFLKRRMVVLINNRLDRGPRTEAFLRFIGQISFDALWITGSFTGYMRRKLIQQGIEPEQIKIFSNIEEMKFQDSGESTVFFAIGNIGGQGIEIVNRIERMGEVLDRAYDYSRHTTEYPLL